MQFEYDNNKSRINKEKHGIDFMEAQGMRENIFPIISVRRCRKNEEKNYENHNN